MPLVAFTCSNVSTRSDIESMSAMLNIAKFNHAILEYWYIIERGGVLGKRHVHGFIKMEHIHRPAIARLNAFLSGEFTPYLRFFNQKPKEARYLHWYNYCMKDQFMFDKFDYYSTERFRNWLHMRGMLIWQDKRNL